jgi:hypothetical protein
MNSKTWIVFLLLNIFSVNAYSQHIKNTPLQQLIPSSDLPKEVVTQNSNNNLDIIKFEERYYVAFRTGPTHFASKKTEMYIISSTDFKEWKFEKKIALSSDVREPRFYASEEKLFFMFFKGGKKKFKFEPQGIFRTSFDGTQWEDIQEIKTIPLGFVPWRIKRYNGVFYLSSYEGINEYKLKEACELRLFVSANGIDWQAISQTPQIDHPRAIAEMAFAFNLAGDFWGVARLEFDGAYIINAKKDSLDKLEYWYSKYKFDSPLMFEHNSDFYLISRRNIKGVYAKNNKKYTGRLISYSFSRKTTALFKLDTLNKSLIHIKDFGTTGDCAFPSIQKVSENEYIVLDYSSNIKKKRKNWITGQLGKTYIYRTKLTFEHTKDALDVTESKGVFKFEKPQGTYE